MKKLTNHPLLKSYRSPPAPSSSRPPITLISFGIDSLQVGLNNTNSILPTPPLLVRCEQLYSSLLRTPNLLANLSLVNLTVTFNDSIAILQRRYDYVDSLTA